MAVGGAGRGRFATVGIDRIERVLTDNPMAYRKSGARPCNG
jgi:hypothetical protein